MAVQSAQTPSPSQTASQPVSIFWFAATTLLGAFLVFQVQPVISKCVLPWFGGTPAVWTTCMLFFQLLLFGGYLYAHGLRTFFSPALQATIHLILLAVAVLMLPIEPSDHWKPVGTESPTVYLLWLLAAHVGLPYFVLSSTGPLVQAWFSYHDQSDRVYRLYALSNAGSLVALLSYPFVVEPVLSVSQQSTVWSVLLCLFLLIQGIAALKLFRLQSFQSEKQSSEVDGLQISWATRGAWIGLPALASTMLLVVTNHVCQDVAVVPFLWVLPLSLYLLSFIVCFDSPQWYRPKWIAAITGVAMVGIQLKAYLPIQWQLLTLVVSFMVFLFGVCLLCHGEVARLKPPTGLLTQYYAMLSAGGAVGGLVVAVVCPMLLSSFVELPLSMVLVQVLVFWLFFAVKGWKMPHYDWDRAYRMRYFAGAMVVLPIVGILQSHDGQTIASTRNFFGVLRVTQDDKGIKLVHGSTVHGMQRRGDASGEPTTYYGHVSGVGRAMKVLHSDARSGLDIGVVGLGCGVLASYGEPEDRFDLIEINPAVVDIAQTHFTFLRDCPSEIHHHLGDGRLVLERLGDRQFDLLVLDAFSSDAIPAHLLTREAIKLYRGRLDREGVLAIHVSNSHLDLAPLVHRLCRSAGMESREIKSDPDPDRCVTRALWILASEPNNAAFWDAPEMSLAQIPQKSELADAPFWTDQHHNLVSVLKAW